MCNLTSLIFGLLPFLSSALLPAQTAAPLPPLRVVQSALRAHRVVFLGDVHPFAEPKALVVDAIRNQGPGSTIDLLALEVAAEHQPVIDRYLASDPEDTTILLTQPRTLRAHWGASRDYLAIYRAVYQWNRDHPGRSLRILAADLRGWPMAPLTARMATGGFANRDEWMARSFKEVLAEHPEWRVLVFMGGYHGLKGMGGSVTVGRATDRFDRWFAGYLADAGVDVYSILTDAPQADGHGATRVFDRLRESARPVGERSFAVVLDSTTDAVDQPIYDVEQEGYALEFWPSHAPLRRAVDALVMLTRPTPITPLAP
jgi:hypothetical protein